MAQTPEGRTKKKIKIVLDKYSNYGLWYFMPVPGGYGAPALDYIGAFLGSGFSIEAKAPGKKLTPRQELTSAQMRAARMRVFVVDGTGDTDTVEDIDAWFTNVKDGKL